MSRADDQWQGQLIDEMTRDELRHALRDAIQTIAVMRTLAEMDREIVALVLALNSEANRDEALRSCG